jgi:hypothetical protein
MRAADRCQPVAGRGAGAGLRRPGVFDSLMTITASPISAPTVSGTDGAVKGTRRQGSHRIVHTLAVVGLFVWPASKQRGASGAPDGHAQPAGQSAQLGAGGVADELDPVAVPAEFHHAA